jgi:hypothetical protein
MFVIGLLALLTVGCTNESADAGSPIRISPLPPECGKSITILYDATRQDAKFRNSKELFVTVDVKHQYGVDTYRMRLDFNSGLYKSEFLVPMNACYIALSVGPREQVMFTETFSSAVYNDGKPVEHSLPHLIYGSRSYEEAREYFRRDESYYPMTVDRFQPMWISRIKYGVDTVGIIHEIDSLYRSVTEKDRSDENVAAALAACASGYYALGFNNKAMVTLSALSSVVSDKTMLPLSALGGFAFIVYDYTDRCMSGAAMPDDRDVIHLFGEIQLIAEKCHDFNLATLLFRNAQYCKQSPVGRAFWEKRDNMDRLLGIAHRVRGEDNIRAIELISGLASALYEQGRYVDVINLVKDRRDELFKATDWVRDSDAGIMSNFPAYGHFSEIQRA